jgi:hypothetical protein
MEEQLTQIINLLQEIKELLQGVLVILFFIPTIYILGKFVFKILE